MMAPIQRSEILPIGEYETIRPRFRARVIEEKRPRRVKIGDHISAVFENRDSVMLQIQEMLRTERITSEPAIMHEIETYNELLPGERQLSVTLFVEIPEKEVRDRMLVELAGLEDTIAIEIDGERFPISGKRPDGYIDGRTTAVHYLKTTISPEGVERIKGKGARVAMLITHPRYEHRVELGRATIAKLAEDLT
jgi:HSP20 family molecular chaperone IbpA